MPRPTLLEAQIRKLDAEIAYLDSTDGHLNRLDAEKRQGLEEERAELLWRQEHPGNSGRYRCAFRGRPVEFSRGGGREAFNTEAEAWDYLRSIGAAGRDDVGVIDTAPDRDSALASVRLHMHEARPSAAPDAESIRAQIARVLDPAGMMTPVGREPARAGRIG